VRCGAWRGMTRPLHLGFVMQGGSAWMGGAEYVKNLLHAALAAATAEDRRIRATLFTGHDLEPEWHAEFARHAAIVQLPGRRPLLNRFFRVGNRALARALRTHGIDFLYPLTYENEWTIGVNFPIEPYLTSTRWAGWIPDFQHKHLPQHFSKQEIELRDKGITRLAAEASMIVFSSETAARDYRTFWPCGKAHPFVLRFCTMAGEGWFEGDPAAVQSRYHLPSRFFLLSNQFWQHKNHSTVFAALGILAHRDIRPHVVCTGNLRDNRAPIHVERLLRQLVELRVQDQVSLLGLVPRLDQIQLMRRSIAVLQPSLSEGWSTVVEDARLLGKPLILSHLAVHREQDPPATRFFAADSAEDLASAMTEAWETRPAGPDVDAEKEARSAGATAREAFSYRFLHFAAGELMPGS
jgi:glycosyltransferase involved in cell wall biosynthesis